MRQAERPRAYDPVMQTIHWATVALIVMVYSAIWSAQSGLAGESYPAIVQLHRSFGITVLGLTLFRLAWRCRARSPELPEDLPKLQKLAARATEALIYLLLLAQPVLGLIHTNARGQQVDLFFLGTLPAIVGPDRALSRLTHNLHELVGNLLLAVIGLHAAAALFHHFVRRDGVLTTMLPARLHRMIEHLRSGARRGKLAAGS